MTPAHHTSGFAELVCTNSLRGVTNHEKPAGSIKEEMRHLNSLIIKAADATALPAGGALAVDRDNFSAYVTKTLEDHPNITIHLDELTALPEGITVVATGPLTSEPLSQSIQSFIEMEGLYFYDAAAPVLEKDSINMEKVYLKSRYDDRRSRLSEPSDDKSGIRDRSYRELIRC